jgi:hypothetical protein
MEKCILESETFTKPNVVSNSMRIAIVAPNSLRKYHSSIKFMEKMHFSIRNNEKPNVVSTSLRKAIN